MQMTMGTPSIICPLLMVLVAIAIAKVVWKLKLLV
jgi:hypothetical protein